MKDLSPREEQVIWLVAKGTTTPDIARILFITETTARNHVQSIMSKTETHSRLAAVHAWRTRKPDHAGRILDYCKDSGIRVTDEQADEIRAMFAEPVRCEDDAHRIPAGGTTCECKLLATVVPGVSADPP